MSESSCELTAPQLEEVLAGLHLELPNKPTANPEMKPIQSQRKCSCCINWVEQYPEDAKDPAEQTSDVKRYAILCRMQKAHREIARPLELHSIVIQIPLLKSVLNGGRVPRAFWELFYHWQALTETQNTHEAEAVDQIRLLLNELTFQLGDVDRMAKDLVRNNVMTYDCLWTLFPPGTLAYSRLLDRDCLLEVQKTEYDTITSIYDLRCRYVEWDGEEFGWKKKIIEIPKFSGTRSIQDLEAYPVTYHKASEDIQLQLVERGQRFVSLSSWQQKAYRGIIRISGERYFGSGELRIDERIMVDAKAFFQHTATQAYLGTIDEKDLESQSGRQLSDRLLMLCSPTVKAYALKAKCWVREVYVDGISDIKRSENAFDNLVLENETKKLIESFISAQIRQNDLPAFDDIVEGKGQGMILLLTGEPGIGKTLTAETVAEKARRPLYMLSAGELGTSTHKVEEGLTKILDLAYRWSAILLLDKSDVFLEQRTSDNLERNQLVSTLQSRIHLTLHYPGLDRASRRKIWQILLERVHAYPVPSEEDLDALAEDPLNRRQIKNAVKSATLLATADDAALSVEHINIVLRVMRKAQISGFVSA
ncbi:P-loop containing nucleoside triphosphate hydrolase protein [Xylaria digitata]|nr:P-loop containing nucleoside triphosphate hydrolase protein [Xylaria digitata]